MIWHVGIASAILASGVVGAHAATSCQSLKYADERSRLQMLLSSNNFPRAERAFVLTGAERRIREVRPNALNARGKKCGINAVRASIFGCMNQTLPSTLRSVPSPARKTGKTFWGKPNVSAREAAFIGIFHACRGGAAEAFLSGL
ncbi:hypothetical protein [Mesorhizobium sp. IMUNJ 23232]|uniref:hypothetical protein n=1 Tax=Mesorhizobium sp. IMUNJ 23232 TaxID=3376064 RepID=UPI00378D8F68